jgi:hypothetical protein
MAKKAASKSGYSDPRKNKSLAIRSVLQKLPGASAADVAARVQKDYGHDVPKNLIYMVKAKTNMAADGRPKKVAGGSKSDGPMNSAATWVEAIKLARQLLKSTGSMANAVALLKAVDS